MKWRNFFLGKHKLFLNVICLHGRKYTTSRSRMSGGLDWILVSSSCRPERIVFNAFLLDMVELKDCIFIFSIFLALGGAGYEFLERGGENNCALNTLSLPLFLYFSWAPTDPLL